MGLYRNIAGFGGSQVGLSLYQPGLVLLDMPSDNSGGLTIFNDPVAAQQQRDAAALAYETEMNREYDYLLNTPLADLTAAGYYVYDSGGTSGSGSVFQWTDAARTTSTAYLPLDWIQKIENERGTPGALLLHMQQPVIAKNTAGFEGGSSATWYAEGGIDPNTQIVSDPIPAVQVLPAVQPSPTTTDATTSPVTTTSTNTTTTPGTQALLPAAAAKNNLLPVAIVAGLGAVAIAGEPLLKKKRKVVYVGGIAALLYLIYRT